MAVKYGKVQFFPSKYLKRLSAYGVTFKIQVLYAGRGHQIPRKANPFAHNEAEEINKKRETKV